MPKQPSSADKAKIETAKQEALKAFWPTRIANMVADAGRNVLSGPISKFAKYGGGPLIQGLGKKDKNN